MVTSQGPRMHEGLGRKSSKHDGLTHAHTHTHTHDTYTHTHTTSALQLATKFHYTKQLKPEKFTHHTTLEVIWTIIPTLIVLSIAVPSLTLIYSLDQHTDRPGLTVKVIGRQWYWSYEMHDHLQQKLVDPERLAAIAEKAILKD
uniref:cytochrome-c oxidase n=1 Tax=Dunaliella tertiolecta TaxID=3047 RepID=A0A7S3R115_DUNTE